MDGLLRRRPFLNQVMTGRGVPDAWQVNVFLFPLMVLISFGKSTVKIGSFGSANERMQKICTCSVELHTEKGLLVERKPTLGFQVNFVSIVRHVQWEKPQTRNKGSMSIQVKVVFSRGCAKLIGSKFPNFSFTQM